ncbi:hypothetical protein TNCV_2867221 [Trichonephila clavipes]|nr:hypothetical protein TNCV_2867221 [Trichonephila clavipes]
MQVTGLASVMSSKMNGPAAPLSTSIRVRNRSAKDSCAAKTPGVGTRHPFRWGKRRTQQIPFVVNNNRTDIKITVAIPRDRRPPIT